MISGSPMQVAKEMEKLGFKPEGVLEDNMEDWTNMLVDALENLAGIESKVFMAMQALAKTRQNELRLAKKLAERHSRQEEDIL